MADACKTGRALPAVVMPVGVDQGDREGLPAARDLDRIAARRPKWTPRLAGCPRADSAAVARHAVPGTPARLGAGVWRQARLFPALEALA